MARGKPKLTIPLPEVWKDNFKSSTLRRSFSLSLSQAMIEFLCATADDVMWDRALYPADIHRPDNWYSTGRCLEKRGLIQNLRNDTEAFERIRKKALADNADRGDYTYWRLTPAGEAVVNLFRVTGIFIESDAAINKRGIRRKA